MSACALNPQFTWIRHSEQDCHSKNIKKQHVLRVFLTSRGHLTSSLINGDWEPGAFLVNLALQHPCHSNHFNRHSFAQETWLSGFLAKSETYTSCYEEDGQTPKISPLLQKKKMHLGLVLHKKYHQWLTYQLI